MSIGKYRTIDLLVLTGLAVLFDSILGTEGLFSADVYVAVSIPFILLCYVRWGIYGILPNIVTTITHIILFRTNFAGVIVAHSVGLMALSIALVLIQKAPMQKLKIRYPHLILYYMICFFTMMTVEWVTLQIVGRGVPVLSFLLYELVNFLIGFGLISLVSRQKDLFVPMKLYFDNLEKEKEKRKSDYEKNIR